MMLAVLRFTSRFSARNFGASHLAELRRFPTHHRSA